MNLRIKEIMSKDYNTEKIIEIFSGIVLFLWCITPVLYEFIPTFSYINNYKYILHIIIGFIGLTIFSYYMIKGKLFIKKNLPIILFSIYMIWTWISALLSKNIIFAFLGHSYRKEGWYMYITYGAFFMLAFSIKSEKIKKLILNTFLIIMVLNIVLMNLVNHLILYRYFKSEDIRASFFPNYNHYGYFLLLGTIVAVMEFVTNKNKFLKVIYLAFYCILLHNLIINNTFGSYLALGASLIILVIYNLIKRENILLSIIGLLIFIIMSIFVTYNGVKIVHENFLKLFKDADTAKEILSEENKYKSNDEDKEIKDENIDIEKNIEKEKDKQLETIGSGRGLIWKYGIKFILKKPIFGYGPDNLEAEYLSEKIYQDRPHNLIIQLATTSGIVGLLLYVGAVRNYYI